MRHRSAIALYAAVLLLGTAGPLFAQFAPAKISDPATGERYHIEGSVGLWAPGAQVSISSESLGIPGDLIDFKNDLGLSNHTFKELRLELRPTKRNKLRFQYIPIEYNQTAVVPRSLVFNGQLYPMSSQVESDLKWKAYRFIYEYDIFSRDRWFGGIIFEAKYTDVLATLDSPTSANPTIHQFTHARAPIPAIGGVARYYFVPNISLTAEVSGIDVPKSASTKYNAHYADVNVYGTVNVNDYVGAQLGYRSFDVGYVINTDTGSFVLKGIYFGIVARY